MTLHFEKHGDKGIPIVILHGFLGSGENWRSIAKILSENYRVYLPDLRNHGKSHHHSEMTYDSMSEDIVHMILNEWSLEKVHLVGHSMGGKLALKINENHPELIDHLYVLDISAREYAGGHENILSAMKGLKLSMVQKRSDAGHLLSEGIPDETVRQFLLKNVVRTADGSYEWRIGLEHLIDNYKKLQVPIELEKGRRTPMSLLYGSRSNYVQSTDIEDFQNSFDQIEIYPFQAGHWLHAVHPNRVIEILSETIEKYLQQ